MDRLYQDHSSVLLGSDVLVFVEVIPVSLLCNNYNNNNNNNNHSSCYKDVPLSAAFSKIHLQELSSSQHPWNEERGLWIEYKPSEHDDDEDNEDVASRDYEMDTTHTISNVGNDNQLQKGYLFHTNNAIHKRQLNRYQGRPLVCFPSEDPIQLEPIPCWVIGYTRSSIGCVSNNSIGKKKNQVSVTNGTLVRVLPPMTTIHVENKQNSHPAQMLFSLEGQLVGETQAPLLTEPLAQAMQHHHNPETLRELYLRMSLQLAAEPVHIGTTNDALFLRTKQQQRRQKWSKSIQAYCRRRRRLGDDTDGVDDDDDGHKEANDNLGQQDKPKLPTKLPTSSCSDAFTIATKTKVAASTYSMPSFMREAALLVPCPHHGAGKTTLVKFIAQNMLQCDAVHVLSPGALLAKYGSQADAALEFTIHSIIMSAAVTATISTTSGSKSRNPGADENGTQPERPTLYQNNTPSICIILDHLDSFMPASLSGRSSAGDAAAPVLNAIASYLKRLILSVKHRREIPFPSKNPLYNVGGKGGYVLAVRVCIVAIITCPDNGWRGTSMNGSIGHASCILDALPVGTYRLPPLNAATRVKAFQWSFQQEMMVLTEEATHRLDSLAASAIWCRGHLFAVMARTLRQILDRHQNANDSLAAPNDLEIAFSLVGKHSVGYSNLAIETPDGSASTAPSDQKSDPFDIVGGSKDVKQSLEDALTLDATKRAMLASMCIEPPIGVLLYGPPGCGKTLLAKAVARLLGTAGSSDLQTGGAFIALNSSEVVQGEIGTSEKIIVAAFQSARENAPSVVFIDEFQALFLDRSSSGSSKLSSTLLQCLDDIRQWRVAKKTVTGVPSDGTSSCREDVVVLGATNTPWMVDKAFLRPGRFDRIVHVGLPDEDERESILNVHMGKMRMKRPAELAITIAKKTSGYSGAELSALCRAAAVRCLLDTSEWVEEKHFTKEVDEGAGGKSNAELVYRNQNWKP